MTVYVTVPVTRIRTHTNTCTLQTRPCLLLLVHAVMHACMYGCWAAGQITNHHRHWISSAVCLLLTSSFYFFLLFLAIAFLSMTQKAFSHLSPYDLAIFFMHAQTCICKKKDLIQYCDLIIRAPAVIVVVIITIRTHDFMHLIQALMKHSRHILWSTRWRRGSFFNLSLLDLPQIPTLYVLMYVYACV